MPIVLEHPIHALAEEDFHELDYLIMKLAFDTHNDLGRFYDEEIYQSELSRRCQAAGITFTKEFTVKLVHGDFMKPLYIDLLINEGAVYELKTCKAIAEPNRIQTLNYLYATNIRHGKLINFRPASVEHEFVSTKLNHQLRQKLKVEDCEWSHSELSGKLQSIAINLLSDWGAFFDTNIYFDAICHFLGAKDFVLRNTSIINGNTMLGHQKIPHLSDTEAFYLTSVSKKIPVYRKHLQRFLNHTDLEYLHWINLNHQNISFISLKRKSFCP